MEDGSITSNIPATSEDAPPSNSNHESIHTPPLCNTARFKWKNIFRIFRPNRKPDTVNEVSQNAASDMFLEDAPDTFAMAVTLPEDAKGKDIRVSIEMKTPAKQTSKNTSKSGLNLLEASSTKAVYYGNIKLPSNVTLETISKMPVYFVSPSKKLKGKGQNKVETIIQPNEDNMPAHMDGFLTVSHVGLKVNLQSLKQNKKLRYKRLKNLSYTFINHERRSNKPFEEERASFVNIETECEECGREVVTDTVATLAETIPRNDISTQYSVTVTNKEMNTQNLQQPQLDDSDTAYPSETASSIDNSCHPQQSFNSCIVQPRFYINYDKDLLVSRGAQFPSEPTEYNYISVAPTIGRFSRERREHLFGNEYVLKKRQDKNINEDIDQTLHLLETAKNKLMSYLSQPISLTEFNREYKYRYHLDPKSPSASSSVTNIFRYSAPTCLTDFTKAQHHKHDTRKWTNPRFFREPTHQEEDLMNLSMFESTTSRLKLNTIQNIYNSDSYTDGDTFTRTSSQTAHDDLLETRYMGDHQTNALTYSIVVNDIHSMIRDLLEESSNIKRISVSASTVETTSIVDDIKSVLNNLLERTEEFIETALIESLEQPLHMQPTIVNYCLMDEQVYEDNTKGLLDHTNTSEMIFPANGSCKILKTSWSFGHPKRMPTVSVRKLSPHTNKSAMGRSRDDLLTKLDRGAVYIQEICNEMYDVIPKLKLEQDDYDDISDSEEIDCQMAINHYETSSLDEVNEEEDIDDFCNGAIYMNTSAIVAHSTQHDHGLGQHNSTWVRVPKRSGAFSTDSSSSTNSKLSQSNRDSDNDITLQLPNITHEYNSMQELNNQDEIDYIELNVETNNKLTTEEGCSLQLLATVSGECSEDKK